MEKHTENLIKIQLLDGYYYTFRKCIARHPIVFVHGIGGHHLNFSVFHEYFTSNIKKAYFQPYYVDLPGFGYAANSRMSIESIDHFLNSLFIHLSHIHAIQPICFVSSASIWLLHDGLTELSNKALFLDNPIHLVKFQTNGDKLDIRQSFISQYSAPAVIRAMNSDKLGRPDIDYKMYKDCLQRGSFLDLHSFDIVVGFYNTGDSLKEHHFKDKSVRIVYLSARGHTAITKNCISQVFLELNNRVMEIDL